LSVALRVWPALAHALLLRLVRSPGTTYGGQGGKCVNLDPGGLLAWLVVGLVAGWLAGQFMKGGGYGVVGDIVLGGHWVIGAFVGGFIFSLVMPGSSVGLVGSIVVAFIGAVVLIALARALTGNRVRA
jgi:uncharacterized membrane protein YeaQ/YmgE (transglycosylase-associated protein family)